MSFVKCILKYFGADAANEVGSSFVFAKMEGSHRMVANCIFLQHLPFVKVCNSWFYSWQNSNWIIINRALIQWNCQPRRNGWHRIYLEKNFPEMFKLCFEVNENLLGVCECSTFIVNHHKFWIEKSLAVSRKTSGTHFRFLGSSGIVASLRWILPLNKKYFQSFLGACTL